MTNSIELLKLNFFLLLSVGFIFGLIVSLFVKTQKSLYSGLLLSSIFGIIFGYQYYFFPECYGFLGCIHPTLIEAILILIFVMVSIFIGVMLGVFVRSLVGILTRTYQNPFSKRKSKKE